MTFDDYIIGVLLSINKETPYESFKRIMDMVETEDGILHTLCSVIDDFYTINHFFPSADYLISQHPPFEFVQRFSFTEELLVDAYNRLKESKTRNKIVKLVQDGKYSEIDGLLPRHQKFDPKKLYNALNVIDTYEQALSEPSGVLSGIPELDQLLIGFEFGSLHVIGAPPSNMKTTLLLSMLYSNVFEHGYSAVFFSFEMPRDQIWAAIICRHAYSMGFELDSMKAKKALFSDDEKEKYYMASKDFYEKSKGNLYILNPEDFLDVSPLAFKHMVSIMDKENGSPVDIIALDYLQRMKGYRISKMDEKEAMNSYVLAFNDMAISHNGKKRCVFLLSQVNREGIKKAEKGGKASMVYFAEASEIERSASTGIILHASDSMKLSNQLQLTVVKRRHGSVIADPIITYANGMYTLIGNVGFQEIFTEDSMSIIGEEDDADFI